MIQGLVAYDLYALLVSIEIAFEQTVLIVFGYVLISLFYLVVFYTSLLGKVFLINDMDLVEHLRENMFIKFRQRLRTITYKYAFFYVHFHLLQMFCRPKTMRNSLSRCF